MGVYSAEMLKAMTPQEITDVINRDTYENAFETQREKHWRYRGRELARGMEHVLVLCPRCGRLDTLRTEGDRFSCTACGMTGVYNEYGFLEGGNLPFDNVLSWMRWMEPAFDRLAGMLRPDERLCTEPEVSLSRMLDGYKNAKLADGTLSVYRDRMELAGHVFPFAELPFLSILYGDTVLFTHHGGYYRLTGETFRAWKCARLWHLAKGDTGDPTKEM